jgi:hypothetical protein
MPGVGFKPTTPEFERTKTVHALDSAATVIGPTVFISINYEPQGVLHFSVWILTTQHSMTTNFLFKIFFLNLLLFKNCVSSWIYGLLSSKKRMIIEWQTGRNEEGRVHSLHAYIIQELVWRYWEKPRIILISIADISAEIQTRNFRSTSYKLYRSN